MQKPCWTCFVICRSLADIILLLLTQNPRIYYDSISRDWLLRRLLIVIIIILINIFILLIIYIINIFFKVLFIIIIIIIQNNLIIIIILRHHSPLISHSIGDCCDWKPCFLVILFFSSFVILFVIHKIEKCRS